ncbi:hypothetical protein PsYK624_152950 [Phanerochaete sordida]|uniref:Uncharacterized protein n=1 Tax=Phanerochaete sordida TaxID=48140 RepID=A0A9P3LL59_9APHY|nr:hypothetical protein PsYK624_152950 [Phanerochaete sordida]
MTIINVEQNLGHLEFRFKTSLPSPREIHVRLPLSIAWLRLTIAERLNSSFAYKKNEIHNSSHLEEKRRPVVEAPVAALTSSPCKALGQSTGYRPAMPNIKLRASGYRASNYAAQNVIACANPERPSFHHAR